uniref:Protein NPAT C-terminal domain-containing protein n=1 Tax=Scophthalmus maximus TaxID=52904 RepID=A0A8D3C6Z8_SCOMX
MLLPSDFARLVLGYLQEEGLSATSQAFIHESPNLKEYAEHTTADGTIPACVFSVFGKSLTTILNEYVAAKAKESCHEVPAESPFVGNFLNISFLNVSLAPQHLVIQNARDRILGDRSLQEKLAENINKILANEPVPQTSKASAATVEPDQSIDEILGLQGEIHMSDDAIHDILEQTESDPAFQALFDLFDNKESDAAGSSSTCLQSDDPGIMIQDYTDYRIRNVTSRSLGESTYLPQVTAVPISPSDSIVAPFTATPDSPMCASASATLTATPASSTPDSPVSFSSSSCAPIAAAPDTSSSAAPSKATASSDNIVALKIIISDNQEEEDAPSDAALNQAITSISGDKIPTIYLSSPAKSPGFIPGIPGTPKTTLDEVALAVSGLQSSEARGSPVAAGKAFVASPLTGTSQAQQSYVIQLPMDATNAALQGTTAGYFLVTEPPTTDLQTRQVLLPAGLSKGRPFATTQFGATTPTLSQGYSAGSALILPSPVKPLVLPISVLGQNTLGNVQMENLVVKVIQPLTAENTSQQDAARRILRFDSSAEVQPQTSETAQTASPAKGKTPPVPRTRPAILGGNKPKRRVQIVRCSTGPQTAGGFVTEAEKSVTLQSQHHHKDPVKKNSRKQDHNVDSQETQSASTSRADSSGTETLKKLESRRRSKSADGTHNRDSDEAKASDCLSSRLSSSDSTTRSVTRKEKEESGRKEAAAEKPPAKSREGRSDRRTPSSSETPHVTANKENEIKGSAQEQHPPSTPTSSVSRDFSPPAVTLPIPNPESKATKTLSKTSSLAKQAAEMLQDIHGLHSPSSTPVKRPGESAADCPRTPSRQKKGKDGEGTPRRPMPPNTPEVPTCSPASEAGSENSINMAAHTLMILSRAAIARTGTPLKDSLRQEGAGDKSPTSSKNSKKRKQPSPAESPSAKKETKRSSSKTRDRKKKLVDCFPHDLDVDKFLSSLHYDE